MQTIEGTETKALADDRGDRSEGACRRSREAEKGVELYCSVGHGDVLCESTDGG